MVDFLNRNEVVIDDNNYYEYLDDQVVDGERMSRGLCPRDYSRQPVGSIRGVPSWDPKLIKLIPRNEWSSRIKDKQQAKSQLSDIRMIGNAGNPIPSLNQGNKGYCWAHSSTHAVMMNRAIANDPYLPLSAYAIACVIKNFRDEGGWGALSLAYMVEHGVPTQEFWPQGSMSPSNNNSRTWEDAAKRKVLGGWADLSVAPYDRHLTLDQVMSCYLQDIPVVLDLFWWGHSVLGLDALEFDSSLPLSDPNRWGNRFLNSWGDSWSSLGMGTLRGNKSIPDGAVASRIVMAA